MAGCSGSGGFLAPVDVFCTPYVRLCPVRLGEGYHSALFSLRLLGACPIHRCEFVDKCLCGRRFDFVIARPALLHAGYCVCGGTAYFTPQTCRRPTMPVDAIKPLLPTVAWLQALSRVSRPVPGPVEARAAHDRAFLALLTAWSEEMQCEFAVGGDDVVLDDGFLVRRQSVNDQVNRLLAPVHHALEQLNKQLAGQCAFRIDSRRSTDALPLARAIDDGSLSASTSRLAMNPRRPESLTRPRI